jgi:hypothetical protein
VISAPALKALQVCDRFFSTNLKIASGIFRSESLPKESITGREKLSMRILLSMSDCDRLEMPRYKSARAGAIGYSLITIISHRTVMSNDSAFGNPASTESIKIIDSI